MRIDNSLGLMQPIDVWNGYINGNQAIIEESQNALIGNADKRRGPSTLKPDKYFKVGQIVRRISDAYLKADVRSNKMKQSGRWSDETYRIAKVFTTANAPPSYTLEIHTGAAPANFKTRINSHGVTVSQNNFSHDKLQLVIAQNKTPADMMDSRPNVPDTLSVGDRIEVAWVPITYTMTPNTKDLAINYANIEQRVGKDLASVGVSNAVFYEGEVSQRHAGKLSITFDDGAKGDISITQQNWAIYVKQDSWNKL